MVLLIRLIQSCILKVSAIFSFELLKFQIVFLFIICQIQHKRFYKNKGQINLRYNGVLFLNRSIYLKLSKKLPLIVVFIDIAQE